MSQQRTGKIPVTSSREDTLSESQWSMEFDNYEEGGTAITTDLSQNDRAVHIDFFNSFEDIFDDDALD
ncbi:hypothetical protein GBAR_LOCUS23080 [Geodia barretti]|uniref:COP9 signalosome complex subunit 9 n=1 Tax=Geodia barretti TaxID=519541 RepID=A0AA35T5B8_GEOBA|nr:hypothetical protein GBAR_LOCUS23080 [Geodia barretti]